MAKNTKMQKAKELKNDEFYTLYSDIEAEVNAYLEYDPNTFKDKVVLLPCDDPEWSNFTLYFAENFQKLGLRKLISTSFAIESKNFKEKDWQPTLFEQTNPIFDIDKTRIRGKIFTLDRDIDGDGRIDRNDLVWSYIDCNGDYRSDEVTALRDEADIIVTNPPFSMFRDFVAWIIEAHKRFLIIGSKNTPTYKEIAPLILTNQIWSGYSAWSGGMWFETRNLDDVDRYDANGVPLKNVAACWFTNMEHGRRHEPLGLLTMRENIKHSKRKEVRGKEYLHYLNYDALEVPYTESIPADYDGLMGVPPTFIEKFCPDQFELVGYSLALGTNKPKNLPKNKQGGPAFYVEEDGEIIRKSFRYVIRHKHPQKEN